MTGISTRFYKLEEDYDKKMKSVSDANAEEIHAAQLNTNTTAPNSTNNLIRVEKMKFAAFDGNIRKYPKFKEEFETHIKPTCRESQQAFVLKSFLCDELKEEIDCIGNDIDEIWERLDRRFGNESRLVDTILSDIKAIKYCENEELTLKMIKTIERCNADLKSMN